MLSQTPVKSPLKLQQCLKSVAPPSLLPVLPLPVAQLHTGATNAGGENHIYMSHFSAGLQKSRICKQYQGLEWFLENLVLLRSNIWEHPGNTGKAKHSGYLPFLHLIFLITFNFLTWLVLTIHGKKLEASNNLQFEHKTCVFTQQIIAFFARIFFTLNWHIS